MVTSKMSLRQFTSFTLFAIAVFYSVNALTLFWQEYELTGFDNSVDGPVLSTNIKPKRLNRTTFGITGTVELLTDFSNDFELEAYLYHSARGNNQFVKLPYKVPKCYLCDFMDGMYITYGVAQDLADGSDFPEPKKTESLCAAYKRGNYTIRQYILGKNTIPSVLQAGYYKGEIILSEKSSGKSSKFNVFMKLY